MRHLAQWGICPTGITLLAFCSFACPQRAAETNRWPASTLAEWQTQRSIIASNMQSVMGPLPGSSRESPLELETKEEADAGEFVRKTIAYTPERGSRVNAYLLVPK